MGQKRVRDLAGCAGVDLMHKSRPTIQANTYGELDFPQTSSAVSLGRPGASMIVVIITTIDGL